jgi:negative regulator of flagellin synthesis FlgM
VAIEIKGVDAGPVGSGAGQPVERVRGIAAVGSGTTQSAAPNSADRINITGTARTLATLQAAVAAAPELDMKRVEQLRLSIERGTYVPNPARIADRLLQLETDIAAATGRAQG